MPCFHQRAGSEHAYGPLQGLDPNSGSREELSWNFQIDVRLRGLAKTEDTSYFQTDVHFPGLARIWQAFPRTIAFLIQPVAVPNALVGLRQCSNRALVLESRGGMR